MYMPNIQIQLQRILSALSYAAAIKQLGLLLLFSLVCYTQSTMAQSVTFSNTSYAFDLNANVDGSVNPIILGTVTATIDSVEYDPSQYSLLSNTSSFAIGSTTGVVTYIGNGESAGSIGFTVNAYFELIDEGPGSGESSNRNGTADIVVTINVANQRPVFTNTAYTFTLMGGQSGTGAPITLGTVTANDPDGTILSYAITAGNDDSRFAIDSSGVVSYIGTGENFPVGYALTVEASDVSLTAAATVTINVTNQRPVFTNTVYTFTLMGGQSGTGAPITLGTVTANDPNGTTLSYTIIAGNDDSLFTIDSSGGVSYIGTGESTSHTLTVEASDGSLTAAATVTINVTNQRPVFTNTVYTFTLMGGQSGTGTPITLGTVTANDPNGTILSYTIIAGNDDSRFAIDSSGVVSYIGTGESTSRTLTVAASDASLAATATVTINVTNQRPVFTNTVYTFTLMGGQSGTGTPITLGTVTANDPNGTTLSYTIIAGNDDSRFAIDSSGVVSYIGTGESTSRTLTVEASDVSLAAAATVTINVTNQRPVFTNTVYTFTLMGGQSGTGTPITLGTVTANDPNGTTLSYTIIAGDPLRFSIHASSGVVSYIGNGEPETASYTLTVVASDGSLTAAAIVTVSVLEIPETSVNMAARTRAVIGVNAIWGRAIAIDAADIVSGRLTEVPHTTVLNRPLRWNMLRWSDVVPRWNGVEREFKINIPNIKLDDLIYGSSFLLPLNADGDGSSLTAPNWNVWGRGRISYVTDQQDGLDVDTTLYSYFLGADYQWSNEVLAGVAVSYNRGEGEILNTAQDKTEVDLELGSVYPYVNVSLREGVSVWGLVGIGRGETEIKDADGTVQTDLQMQMAALGVRTELLSSEALDMALKLDVRTVEMTTDAVSGLINATEVKAHRLRMALAAKADRALSTNERLISDAELGGRLDGGDDDTGEGLDLGVGINYVHTKLRFGVGVRGHWLLASRDNTRKEWSWGTGLNMYLRASPLGRGLSFSWTPGWGGPLESQVGSLWQNEVQPLDSQATTVAEMSWSPHRQQLSLGYGWGLATGLLTPFAEMNLGGGDLDRARLGTRFAIPLGGSELRLSLHGNRLSAADNPHYQLGADVSVGF